MSNIAQIWRPLPSGILLPTGNVTDTSASSKSSYLQLKDKATVIEALYAKNGLSIPPTSSLARLIADAKHLWENFVLNNLQMEMLFNGMHLDRIADAVLPLHKHPNPKKYLQSLLNGDLNFFKRDRSPARDFFWEIELCYKLQRKVPQTFLQDPPDIIMNFEDTVIGVACKKFYSEKHVQEVLSKGVRQIEATFEFGFVAFNIDELLPKDAMLNARDNRHVEEVLQGKNHEFIQRHGHRFRNYMLDGRLLGVLVSTTVIADIADMEPRLHNASQWTIWTLRDTEEKYKRQINRLYHLVMN